MSFGVDRAVGRGADSAIVTLSLFLLLAWQTDILMQVTFDWTCIHVRMGFAWLVLKVGSGRRDGGRHPTADAIPVTGTYNIQILPEYKQKSYDM